jgi:hypothetical protein
MITTPTSALLIRSNNLLHRSLTHVLPHQTLVTRTPQLFCHLHKQLTKLQLIGLQDLHKLHHLMIGEMLLCLTYLELLLNGTHQSVIIHSELSHSLLKLLSQCEYLLKDIPLYPLPIFSHLSLLLHLPQLLHLHLQLLIQLLQLILSSLSLPLRITHLLPNLPPPTQSSSPPLARYTTPPGSSTWTNLPISPTTNTSTPIPTSTSPNPTPSTSPIQSPSISPPILSLSYSAIVLTNFFKSPNPTSPSSLSTLSPSSPTLRIDSSLIISPPISVDQGLYSNNSLTTSFTSNSLMPPPSPSPSPTCLDCLGSTPFQLPNSCAPIVNELSPTLSFLETITILITSISSIQSPIYELPNSVHSIA